MFGQPGASQMNSLSCSTPRCRRLGADGWSGRLGLFGRGAARAAGQNHGENYALWDSESHLRSPDQAPETDVSHARVDHLRLPRGRTIAEAVVGRAQVRAALDDFPRNAKLWLLRIVTLLR
jgi:hypothetical protein